MLKIFLTLFAVLVLTAQAAEARRIALVIGNDRYTAMTPLVNPVNDATAVAGVLRANKFDVFSYSNLTREKLLDALDAFRNEAVDAEVAVIYYAGHGLELGGKNIVAPVDMEFACEQAQPRRMVELDKFFEAIQNVPQQVVLLDACRNDPFPQCAHRGSSGAGFRGIEVAARRGSRVLVASSTLSGRLAADGQQGGHSPFAAALLAKFNSDPRTPLRNLLDEVARDVALGSNGGQTPEVTTRGGAPDVCLAAANCGGSSAAGPVVQVTPRPPDSGSACNADFDYQDALRKNTVEAYRDFLSRCPNDKRKETILGLYARLADEELWQTVARENTLSGYVQYLAAFPSGIYIEQAKRKRDELQGLPNRPTAALPSPIPERPSPPPPPVVSLLQSISLGVWAIGSPSNCSVRKKTYSLEVASGSIIWRSGVGNTDVETINFNSASQAQTTTVRSDHITGRGEAPGTIWNYKSIGPDQIQVTPGGRSAFMLARCR